ncbi:MAG: RQC-minor-1 family DNA-binding protein [Gammaproteobacteria bacterium]|nr:MAG: RQC-minor-1 family DNA-binding protein [Gammaproteobacteria bacterium]
MSRKVRHVPVLLDAQGIAHLPAQEIAIILRGADELIMRGGRSLLAKVLKGSREKKLQDLSLDQSPAFGALRTLSLQQILSRIDWLIINNYFAIEYDYRLPLLAYTPRGWEIEKKTYAAELQRKLDHLIASGDSAPDLAWLNDSHREVLIHLLDRIEVSGDRKYIPALENWSQSAVKKIRSKIRGVVENLLRD